MKYKIQKIYYNLKQRFQRFIKGYADIDVWNFDNWFLETIPKLLDKLKDDGHSHPIDMDAEEWEKYVINMSNHFKEASKIDDFLEFPPDTSLEVTSKAYEKLRKECEEHLHKGFEMMEKRFFDLWD